MTQVSSVQRALAGNYKRAENAGMRAPALHQLWLATLAASVALLVFYRSDASHGPDMVGIELTTFGLPLIVAFGMSIVVYRDGPPPSSLLFRFAPLVTGAVGIAEVYSYFAFFMR